ncbi:MAG: hypothetical protein ACOZNI_18900 [Myxococcota bacterium]
MSPLFLLFAPAAAAEISVVGSLLREDAAAPGGAVEGRVAVRNNTDEPVRVLAYVRDYAFYADGRNVYADPGSLARSNSAWLRFSPEQVEIPPHGTTSLSYRVDVPADATLAGTYWSILMVEPMDVRFQPADPDARSAVSIRTVIRYGVQIVTHVGDTPAGTLRLADRQLLLEDGEPVLSVDIANEGGGRLAPKVWAEVFDEEGRSLGRFPAARDAGLLPGCSVRYPIRLEGLRAGRYSALVVADAGEDAVFGAEYTLDLR